MNILFFGLGSIGQRHIRNILKLKKNIKIYAFRKSYTAPLLNYNNQKIKGDTSVRYKINNIKDLSFFVKNKIKIDCAFICSPSSFHVKQAIWCIKNNIPIFVEKPVATNFRDLNKINFLIKKKPKLPNVVGYQLRFNPLINYLKTNIFLKKKLGQIYNCEIFHGENVTDFHPYENYQESYASKKSLGGGVILTQIHELDYLNYLFENYSLISKKYFTKKISKLKIDVEDNYIAIFTFLSKKKENVIAKVTCSYMQIPRKRDIFVSCEKGSVYVDLVKQKITILTKNKKFTKIFKFKRNNMFKDEIKYFFKLLKKNNSNSRKLPSILDDRITNSLALSIKN
jgi:predicted dehydrogenase